MRVMRDLVGSAPQLGDEQLHGLAAGALVAILVCAEPFAIVVAREVPKELEPLAGKAVELWGHEGSPHRPGSRNPSPAGVSSERDRDRARMIFSSGQDICQRQVSFAAGSGRAWRR